MKKIIYISFFSIILISCNTENPEDLRKKIAAVNNVFLYEDDLITEIPSGLAEDDSINFTNQYINNWIKDQLVLKKAEDLLPGHVKNINKKVEKYRNSLLTYEYEQVYIKKRLDTIINFAEIEEYYNNIIVCEQQSNHLIIQYDNNIIKRTLLIKQRAGNI